MEKITKEFIVEFISINEIELFPTQSKMCLPIINRIFKKMNLGISFSAIKVDNNLICDGHHRFISSLLANFKLDYIPATITSATKAIPWEYIIFEEEDWDTPAKIKMLNQYDAEFNNLTVEKINELLK